MANEELIRSIADGTLSLSRVKRIAKAAADVDLTPAEIKEVTGRLGIATPGREPSGDRLRDAYPDRWSILLEARSFWLRVRRYWGDDAAMELQERIQNATAGRWRALREQFQSYVDPQIYDRRAIDLFAADILLPLELESLYSWDLQRDMYLQACEREFQQSPGRQDGARFPLPSEEFQAFRKQQFKADCIRAFEREFGSEQALIDYFAEFWREVETNRDRYYFRNLKKSFVGATEQPISQKPFYTATEHNFRHFLHNLNGFRNRGPWRVALMHDPARPLPMHLEGALAQLGWRKVQGLATLGIVLSGSSR